MVDIKKSAIEEYIAIGPSKGQYRDSSMVIIMPTRGMVHWKVWRCWDEMTYPMNHWRLSIDLEGREVSDAYNELVDKALMVDGKVKKNGGAGVRFILSREDDNLPDRDGIMRLLDAIYTCIDCGEEIDEEEYSSSGKWQCRNGHKGLDAVSGLYMAKVDPPIPFAFGDPKLGTDMKVLNLQQAAKDKKVVEVNGVPQGFLLTRLGLYREMSKPWYKTLDGVNRKFSLSQDIYFCKKAKEEAGARFAVDCGARVGHMDVVTRRIY